ncbi:hypothetical protein O181_014130 [Austropuccinia psidii MF-1]|uniref:DUF4939 domain-containing protein n=1 Tax=Austropuccinia psidii MF-1 TaxID=1389203 RepID=A0A9Q3GPM0_9BASI|nr:hypothetical protein [Austropuccinia psidii MF-1]
MPVQHSTTERQTKSQAVLTPTPRAPLDSTPAVPQLRAHFGRSSTIQEGRKRAKKIKFIFRNFKYHFQRSRYVMQNMTQIMANLQAASSSRASRPPAFKTPSMKAPEFFNGTQPFEVRIFIQSCQLIFHNDLANFSKDRRKVLYATSFLIGRDSKWIEPYLSNLTN